MLRFIFGIIFGMIIALAIMIGAPDTTQFLTQMRSIVLDGFDAPLYNRARQITSQNLFDPYSAQFTDLKKIDTDIGFVVCGSVNAKNRMGAYVGAKRFIYEDVIKLAIIESEDAVRDVFAITFRYCSPDYRKPGAPKSDKEVKIETPTPAYTAPSTQNKSPLAHRAE